MHSENHEPPEVRQPADGAERGAGPPTEDAHEPNAAAAPQPPPEDDPALLAGTTRALDGDVLEAPGEKTGAQLPPASNIPLDKEAEDAGDTDSIVEEDVPISDEAPAAPATDWQRETSAHRIAVELKRIEKEVRQLLEGRDSKRKRKLTGTRRWHELEEDMLAWYGRGRVEDDALDRLRELVARRHYLFRRLRFMAGTRQTWNT